MAKFRESVVSNCERNFIIECLNGSKRIDGRNLNEFRKLKIEFGKDWGCCYVSLGETRVLSQVSCEVQQPNSSRPSEGVLHLNVELNPMAAPEYEAGRMNNTEQGVQLNRLLEKCIKDSRAIDLESLCIKVNEKVWMYRVDVNVLNNEGNLIDCCSVAALASLAHFRRPDVTCSGEEFIVHTLDQRDPISTVVHHYPVCMTFAIFSTNSDTVIADPTLLEEKVADAHLTFGLNGYKELCTLHLGGSSLLTQANVLETLSKATQRADEVINYVKARVQEDGELRLKSKSVGFHTNLQLFNPLTIKSKTLHQMDPKVENQNDINDEIMNDKRATIKQLSSKSAILLPSDEQNMDLSEGECDSSLSSSSTIEEGDTQCSSEQKMDEANEINVKVDKRSSKAKKMFDSSSDSEEEHVIVLNADEKTNKRKKLFNW